MVYESREVNVSKQTMLVEIFESVAQFAEETDNKRRRQQPEAMLLWSGRALTSVSCRVVSCCKEREAEACTASVRQWKVEGPNSDVIAAVAKSSICTGHRAPDHHHHTAVQYC